MGYNCISNLNDCLGWIPYPEWLPFLSNSYRKYDDCAVDSRGTQFADPWQLWKPKGQVQQTASKIESCCVELKQEHKYRKDLKSKSHRWRNEKRAIWSFHKNSMLYIIIHISLSWKIASLRIGCRRISRLCPKPWATRVEMRPAVETCGSMLTNPSPISIHRLLFGNKVFRYSKMILDLACVDHDFPCPIKPARNCGENDWISYNAGCISQCIHDIPVKLMLVTWQNDPFGWWK